MSTHLALIGAAGFISMATFRVMVPLLPAIADEHWRLLGQRNMRIVWGAVFVEGLSYWAQFPT